LPFHQIFSAVIGSSIAAVTDGRWFDLSASLGHTRPIEIFAPTGAQP